MPEEEKQCMIFRLPYEIRYQIFREAMGIYPSLGINFVFHAPIQTPEWREEMKERNVWRYGMQRSKKYPCTLEFPPVDRKPPLQMLLVSHRFSAEVLTIFSEAINHDLAVINFAVTGSTPYSQYIDPAAITSKFLSCVSAGRFVFAGYGVNTARPILTAEREDSVAYIPQAVRHAVTSVFFTKALLMRQFPAAPLKWDKLRPQIAPADKGLYISVVLDVLDRLPAVKVVALSVPLGNDDEGDNKYLQTPGRRLFEMFEQGRFEALEIVYEAGDPNALNWGSDDLQKKYREWGRLTGRWKMDLQHTYVKMFESPLAAAWGTWWSCSPWRVKRVDDGELDSRGRYIRALEYESMLNKRIVEESVVWRITRK